LLIFGTSTNGLPSFVYDTVCNTGKVPLALAVLKLRRGSVGFAIDSADMSDIPAGSCRAIKLRFTPVFMTTVTDTLIVGDECLSVKAIVMGNGGGPPFTLSPDM